MTIKVLAETLKPGDIILPPARELQLWMRRRCAEKGLPETALHLTIVEVRETKPDKGGRWLLFKCNETAEWTAGQEIISPFSFKTRPKTPWPKVA